MTWTDTHAHIYSAEFDKDRAEMMQRCDDSNVSRIFMPNVDHTSIDQMMEVEARWPGKCYAMMGLHPCSVKKDFERELYIVEEWLSRRKFSAIGEIGTDRYWDTTYWEQQQEAFRIQLAWAKRLNLPVVIHCRNSIEETIEMVEQAQDGSLAGVFHCFSGTAAQAHRITKIGFYLGIGGVATFKNGGLDKVLPEVDMQQIVMETDSPYLAPVPYRGTRNEPSYTPLIATKIAQIKNISLEEISNITTANATKLFVHLAGSALNQR